MGDFLLPRQNNCAAPVAMGEGRKVELPWEVKAMSQIWR